MRRRVVFTVFPGFELLDLAGPASVFSTANLFLKSRAYEVVTASSAGGTVESFGGIEVGSVALSTLRPGRNDTVIAVGGLYGDVRPQLSDEGLLGFWKSAEHGVERIGSVCTGAYILGAAGLLEGRSITTHWAACDDLAAKHGESRVDPESLYVKDGRVWTAAGVTSGIDMALAMATEDHGPDLKARIARMLVVYAHRPGHQSQFSDVLSAQTAAAGRFTEVLDWIVAHLEDRIRVADLAQIAGMSERTFVRKFSETFATSPGRFVEAARLERARQLLEAGAQVKTIPASVGFRSEAGFRRAFESRFGLPPSLHRRMHGAAAANAAAADSVTPPAPSARP